MPSEASSEPMPDGAARVPLGPIGHYVIQNLTRLREARKLSYRELSDRLASLGRPIPTLGLSRIEKGNRRVDADDLVALALALGVNPTALLLPSTRSPDDEVQLAHDVPAAARAAWRWADGQPVPVDEIASYPHPVFLSLASDSRPAWDPGADALPPPRGPLPTNLQRRVEQMRRELDELAEQAAKAGDQE